MLHVAAYKKISVIYLQSDLQRPLFHLPERNLFTVVKKYSFGIQSQIAWNCTGGRTPFAEYSVVPWATKQTWS